MCEIHISNRLLIKRWFRKIDGPGNSKISKTNGPGQVEIEIVPEDQGQEGKMKMKNCETVQHPCLNWTLLSDVDRWSLNNPTRKQKQQQQIVSEKF